MRTAMNTEQRYLTYAAAVAYTGMSAMTLRRAVEAGRLKACRPEGQRAVRFDVRELDRFVRGNDEPTADRNS